MTSAELKSMKHALSARGLLELFTDAAREQHTTLDEALGDGKAQHLARARIAFWSYLARSGWSISEIARFFKRDRRTVSKGIGRLRDRAEATVAVMGERGGV